MEVRRCIRRGLFRSVGRHVDFVVGVFDDLRVCGQGVDIVLYFSEFAASGAVFGDEVAV